MRFHSLGIVIGLICCALAAYPSETNTLYIGFTSCSAKVAADISCIENVKGGLEKLSDYINKVRQLKQVMDKMNSGFVAFAKGLQIIKYIPKVGQAVSVLSVKVNLAKRSFNSAYSKVKSIDAKIYPYKARADAGVAKCDEAIRYLSKAKTVCDNGKTTVNSARSCVNAMPSGSVKTNLGNYLETMGRAMNPLVNTANTALGSVGRICNTYKSITNIIRSWPNIDFIKSGIDRVYRALKPVLDFFSNVQDILGRGFCIKDPVEVTREGAERALEFTKERGREAGERTREAAEKAREAASYVNPGRWGWGKRKRSLYSGASAEERRALIRVSREMANSYVSVAKRGRICLSAKKILEGVAAILKPLTDLVEKALAPLFKILPSFDIPGMPNFSALFRINLNFNLPSINFGLDLNFFRNFGNFNLGCATEVKRLCALRIGSINVNCAVTYGKRQL